jgi:hypothetical protein
MMKMTLLPNMRVGHYKKLPPSRQPEFPYPRLFRLWKNLHLRAAGRAIAFVCLQ